VVVIFFDVKETSNSKKYFVSGSAVKLNNISDNNYAGILNVFEKTVPSVSPDMGSSNIGFAV
jgi:hypothetical protein